MVADASTLSKADARLKAMQVSDTTSPAQRDAAKSDASQAALPGDATEPQQPDTALMLMAGLGMLGTVVFRVSKR